MILLHAFSSRARGLPNTPTSLAIVAGLAVLSWLVPLVAASYSMSPAAAVIMVFPTWVALTLAGLVALASVFALLVRKNRPA